MILHNLTLNNWMIFTGVQKVQFASGPANITVIFGENMHGKTSLLNAIRWCLYGKALNRQNQPIHPTDLINSVAHGMGEQTCSVMLEFEVDNITYEMWRELNLTETRQEIDVRLKIDGRAVDAGKIANTIDLLLPEQISQFMLFDGELLRNFEQLVVEQGSTQAIGIKNAIEATLGLPMLRLINKEAGEVAKKYKQENKKYLKQNQVNELVIGKLDDLETKLETKKQDRDELKDQIDGFKRTISDLSEELHNNNEALKLLDRKKTLTAGKREAEEKQKKLREDLKQIAQDLWLFPLREAVKPLKLTYSNDLEALEKKKNEQYSKSIEMIKLKKSLENNSCPTCGAELAPEKINTLNEQLHELQEDPSSSVDFEELKFDTKTKMRKLDFHPEIKCDPNFYLAKKDRDAEYEFDIMEKENKIYELEQKLRGVDEEKSQLTRNKYDAINKELGVLEHKLDECDGDIEKINSDIRNIENSSEFKQTGGGSATMEKANLAAKLQDISQAAIGLYRDHLRVDIEKRATETFGNLTTENTFDKLEINESYGLSLIVEGTKVNRSAGAEQIVAMSLIEALNHHGRRKGPMIMDTPVGRLDNKHRKNILQYLPKVVTQLSIFAHSGELSETSNLLDPDQVGKRIRINRKGTFESELEEI